MEVVGPPSDSIKCILKNLGSVSSRGVHYIIYDPQSVSTQDGHKSFDPNCVRHPTGRQAFSNMPTKQ